MKEQELEADADFGENMLEQIFSLWVEPELERRGLPGDRSTVHKALVTFSPDQTRLPVIAINEEAELIGSIRAARDIKAGEAVTEDDVAAIEGIKPANIDPNSGWIAYAVLGGTGFIEFDFRYNKERASQVLTLATEYLTAAETCLKSLPRPAIDNLYSAAELSVQAQMYGTNSSTKQHWKRAKWLDSWAKLKNAPAGHPTILHQLHKERASARYGDGQPSLTPEQLSVVVSQVREMISFAAQRTGNVGKAL
ncbi:SAF domain-containing protein [Arthrobacter sp. Leaf137]|uniref:SAF domain-containing protein n=1 Tax=Arthrobacter sp. Leaf137 TaxID=1736271 RepID=UPI0006F44210|nr:SAF domain-containing protein [Arthrobacter sp. Leaf137]KQQ88834.1 hypothetical protein ASF64_18580 [Arthrobacter sp. Leaf137]